MECNRAANLKKCKCTYTSCSRRGICCECIAYHRARKELPGCCFTPEVEKEYDRSFERFVEMLKK